MFTCRLYEFCNTLISVPTWQKKCLCGWNVLLFFLYLLIYAATNKSWSDSSLWMHRSVKISSKVALEGWVVVVTHLYLGFWLQSLDVSIELWTWRNFLYTFHFSQRSLGPLTPAKFGRVIFLSFLPFSVTNSKQILTITWRDSDARLWWTSTSMLLHDLSEVVHVCVGAHSLPQFSPESQRSSSL